MSNISCPLMESEATRIFVAKFTSLSFNWIRPFCLIAGLVGHVICLVAFIKQTKKEDGTGYKFQVYEALAKTGATIGGIVDTFVYMAIIANPKIGRAWPEGTYTQVWMTSHVAASLHDFTTSIALFVSLSVSLDRTYAISKPMKYKNINRKKWETMAIGSSILISILINGYVPIMDNIGYDETSNMYTDELNEEWAIWTNAWANVRSVVWALGVIGTIVSGFYMVAVYKKNNKVVATLTQSYDREKQQRAAERTLFLLALYDSVQAAIEISLLITHTMLGFIDGFYICEGDLFYAVRVIVIGVLNGSDFYVMILVSKQFRKVIREAIGLKN